MLAIAGIYDTGWLAKEVERAIWTETAKAYAVDEVLMAADAPSQKDEFPKILREINKIEDVLTEYADLQKVFVVSPKNSKRYKLSAVNLRDFKHPENAFYIFGNNCYSFAHLVQPGDLVINIEMAEYYPPWAIVICGIVLYDRLIKCQ